MRIFLIIIQNIFLLCGTTQLFSDEYKERFEKIYKTKMWGTNEEGKGFSGGGSLLEAALPYYDYLIKFMKDNNIKSVVDLGCGDWTFSKHVDWSGIDYKGYDVVEDVIKENIKKYASDHIQFFCVNFIHAEIPKADLMICKHVLQHMPNRDVFSFLKLLPKFKHCLILNAMPVNGKNIEHQIIKEFPFWDDRGIDLTRPPFNIKGEKVLIYQQNINASGFDELLHIKSAEVSNLE